MDKTKILKIFYQILGGLFIIGGLEYLSRNFTELARFENLYLLLLTVGVSLVCGYGLLTLKKWSLYYLFLTFLIGLVISGYRLVNSRITPRDIIYSGFRLALFLVALRLKDKIFKIEKKRF